MGKKRKMPFSGTGRGLWGVGVCCSIHQSEKQKTKLKNSDFVEILLMAIFSSLFMQSMAPNLILLLTLIGGIYDFYSNVKFPSCQRPSGRVRIAVIIHNVLLKVIVPSKASTTLQSLDASAVWLISYKI